MNPVLVVATIAATIASTLIVSLVGTSNPEELWLRQHTTEPILVWNRGPLSAVERTDGSSMRMRSPLRVALIDTRATQYRLAFQLRCSSGIDSVRLYLRTTERDYAERNRQGIAVTLHRHGLRIADEERTLAESDELNIATPHRIALEHDGTLTTIAVDCAVFGPYRTQLPATQYTLVEAFGAPSAEWYIENAAVEAVYP